MVFFQNRESYSSFVVMETGGEEPLPVFETNDLNFPTNFGPGAKQMLFSVALFQQVDLNYFFDRKCINNHLRIKMDSLFLTVYLYIM